MSKALFGVYPALVTDVRDPDGQGRVKIRLTGLDGAVNGRHEAWARLATLMAGNGRGSWFVPDQGDEVLVAFERGDVRTPYVIGSLWNGVDHPPESMDGAGANAVRALRTRSGLLIRLSDETDQPEIAIDVPGGARLTLRRLGKSVELRDADGNEISLKPGEVSIQAGGVLKISASKVEIDAGEVDVNAGVAKFTGVVQCATLMANSVIAASYTPGAGNIW
ncbi:MAG: phage baseplate assembly protein V [Gemmatimonadales bacterium]